MPVPKLRLAIAGLVVAAGLAVGAAHAASEAGPADTYLLAVGVCPPYRHDIPVVVCTNAVDAIARELGEALGIARTKIVTLTGEKATGSGFLAALADLGTRLTGPDRLILYLHAHGDPFGLWTSYYGDSGTVGEINARYYDPDDYVLVFWTKDEPTVPALALAQKDWLTVEEVVGALETLPASVALILDSCSSGRVFAGIHAAAKEADRIDFVLAAAGVEQMANVNAGKTMPLFTEALVSSLDMPMVSTLGEAVGHARATTVLQATALCATMTIPKKAFADLVPGSPVPNQRTHDDLVSPPLWLCSQVPSVVDFSGKMSEWPLYSGTQ